MKKDTLRLVVLLALVSVFAVVIRTNPGAVELSAERLTTYIDGLGMLGPIVFILTGAPVDHHRRTTLRPFLGRRLCIYRLDLGSDPCISRSKTARAKVG